MNTVIVVLITVAVLTAIDALTLFVAYRKRDILIPRIRTFFGAASSQAVSDLSETVDRLGDHVNENFENSEKTFNQAVEAGNEEVIALGRRIDEVSDRVDSYEHRKAKKSRKIRR